MTTEVTFPRAVAQMAANVINNTLFSMDSTNRVHVVTPFALKFDRAVVGSEARVVEELVKRYDGNYVAHESLSCSQLVV